jgi:hypothetical protein
VICNKTKRLWQAFVSGELAPKQQKRLDAHLQQCEPCRLQKKAFASSRDQAMEWWPVPNEMTAEEWARILNGLPHQKERSSFIRLGLLMGGAAAVVAMAVLLVLAHPAQLASDGKDGGAAPDALSAGNTVEEIKPRSDPDRYEVRMSTSDPKVKIVWVFDRNLDLNL